MTPLVHTPAHQEDQLEMQLSGTPGVTALPRPWPERIVFLAWEVELLTRIPSCQSGREGGGLQMLPSDLCTSENPSPMPFVDQARPP